MIEINMPVYQCEICKSKFNDADSAKACESKAVTYDKGVKIGDTVLITQGEGKGQKAKVERVCVLDCEWGHYTAKYYHHTVAVSADIIGEYGTRFLTFDRYEPV